MGSRASSFTSRACHSYRLGYGLLRIGIRSLASVFWELPSTHAFAAVAMGPGNRAWGVFRNSRRGVRDRPDLHAVRFGQALAGGAFLCLRAPHTRRRWRHSTPVSQQIPDVPANRTGQVLGSMARGYPHLFRGWFPDPGGQLSPPR